MGLEKKNATIRLSDEAQMHLDRIQNALNWFLEDRSSTVRFCARIVYWMLFTPMTVRDLLATLQGLHRHTLPCDCGQMQLAFPVERAFVPRLWQEPRV